ncbi:MAG: tRNA (adenosine(37)-N6)-threonylcarbamoyltransferase complex dimerization subunit type 1 TsaB [Sedimentisphaerales bacterium]|nr:tRNA (adenosine(37)-N6)-threonylcarbamoyltransferase complex dimerization subunit type 1 TsaB [Sedimentisphaerales bacterium]
MAANMNYNSAILAIETSARLGSVALARGPQLLSERSFSAGFRHTRELMPVIAQLTSEQGWTPKQIEQIHLSIGPGSFTGLRIAVALAKALSFAQPHIKIVSVPSTDVLIQNATQAATAQNLPIQNAACIIDAKRKQIYTALYEKNDSPDSFIPGFRTIIPPTLMTPHELLEKAPRPLYLLGQGLKQHAEALTAPDVFHLAPDFHQPHAANVHACGFLRACAGLFDSPQELTPLYLRRPEAIERWEKLHGKD